MTDKQINIAIAKACGWKYVNNETHAPDGSFWWSKELEIPDYCNDLNAMHEAEKVFGEVYSIKSHEYEDWLQSIIEHDQTWRATARQRAEAFLKNINKWEEWSDD
jgi:hypothetical protein